MASVGGSRIENINTWLNVDPRSIIDPADVFVARKQQCQILGALRLQIEIPTAKIMWKILVMKKFGCLCIFGREFLNFTSARVDFAP